MKHLLQYLLIIYFGSLSITLSAQQARLSNTTISKQRSVAAKLLVELDRTPSSANNNNNNGKSNKSKCCNDGIAAPSNYEVLAFGLNSSWYLWQEDVGNYGIPNPIPYLASIQSSWEVNLFKENAEFVSTKSAFVQNNELLISIAGLAQGKYFIEIEHDGEFYATGFSIGRGKQVPSSNNQMNKN